MSKPTKLPEWASGGSAAITEPSEEKKDLGWVVAEKPAAQYFNWLLKNVYDWCTFLNSCTNTVGAVYPGDQLLTVPLCMGIGHGSPAGEWNGTYWHVDDAGGVVTIPVLVEDGGRIKAITVWGKGDASKGWKFSLWKKPHEDDLAVQIGSTQTADASESITSKSWTLTTPETVDTGSYSYFVGFCADTGGVTHELHGIAITKDHPLS